MDLNKACDRLKEIACGEARDDQAFAVADALTNRILEAAQALDRNNYALEKIETARGWMDSAFGFGGDSPEHATEQWIRELANVARLIRNDGTLIDPGENS